MKPSIPRLLLLTTHRSYRNDAFRQAAERLGVEVVLAFDMRQELAAHWRYTLGVDFDRPEEAASTIAAYAAEHPLTAVLAVDDSGVVLAAQAARRLGLPHNDPAAAVAARDKFRMRTLMAAAGVPCPWFRLFSTADHPATVAGQVPFPCVVKPLHLNGSRGVIRADDPEEFVVAAQRLTRILERAEPAAESHSYLVESFIPGVEVALEGMLEAGELTVLALFDKPDPLDGPFFEETLYVTPSRLPAAEQAAIAAAAAGAAAAIGLRTGPVHAELRVNDRGPWLLEVNGRSIGGLCGQTLRFDLDMSLEELILRQACGLPWRPAQAQPCASGVMMVPIGESGVLREIAGVEAARAVPGVTGVEITAPLNYPLVPLPEGDSYLGFIFADGETPAAVEAALRAAHAQLRFEVMPEFLLA
jgi:biotin carboxylase